MSWQNFEEPEDINIKSSIPNLVCKSYVEALCLMANKKYPLIITYFCVANIITLNSRNCSKWICPSFQPDIRPVLGPSKQSTPQSQPSTSNATSQKHSEEGDGDEDSDFEIEKV